MFGVTSVSPIIFLSSLLFVCWVLQAHVRSNFCKCYYIFVEPAVFVLCASGTYEV